MKRILIILTTIVITSTFSEASHFDVLRNSFSTVQTLSDFKTASNKKYEDFRIGEMLSDWLDP